MVVEACVQVALFNKTHKLNNKKKECPLSEGGSDVCPLY